MVDKDTLARKLAALTSDDKFDGKALRLGQSGTDASISLLLQAIDDTMLERDALFAVGKSSVTLRISGKRVQRLVAASEDLNAPADLVEARLGANKPKLTSKLCDVLKALLAHDGMLTLERLRVTDASHELGAGVGVRTLTEALDSEHVAAVANPMDFFLDQITPLASTVIAFKDDDIDTVTGDSEAIGNLQTILDSQWKAFDTAHGAFLSEGKTQNMRLIDQWGAEGQSTLVCVIGNRQCLALVDTEDAAQIMVAWQSAFS